MYLNCRAGSFKSNIPSLKEINENSQEIMQVYNLYRAILPWCSFPAHRYQWFRVKNPKLGLNCMVKSWSFLSWNSVTAFFYFMLWKTCYCLFIFLPLKKKKSFKQPTVIHSSRQNSVFDRLYFNSLHCLRNETSALVRRCPWLSTVSEKQAEHSGLRTKLLLKATWILSFQITDISRF